MKINQAETAIEHFHSPAFQYQTVSKQEAQIMEKMRPSMDYTIGELAWLTKLDKSAISGRRNDMLRKGLLIRGIARKCTFSYVHCETVRLP